MGLRYRKSIKIAKGVRLNIGSKSVGISAGVKGARISSNTRSGTRVTVSAPGTGLSYSQKLGGTPKRRSRPKTASVYRPLLGYVIACEGCGKHIDLSYLTDPGARITCPACPATMRLSADLIAQATGQAPAPSTATGSQFLPNALAPQSPVAPPAVDNSPVVPGSAILVGIGGAILYIGFFVWHSSSGVRLTDAALGFVALAWPILVVTIMIALTYFELDRPTLQTGAHEQPYRNCPQCSLLNPTSYTNCAKCKAQMDGKN